MESSEKSLLAAILLCWFFGCFGIHRFYVGKIGTGILMLITFGGLGIWWTIDFIILLCGRFRDQYGKLLVRRIKVRINERENDIQF